MNVTCSNAPNYAQNPGGVRGVVTRRVIYVLILLSHIFKVRFIVVREIIIRSAPLISPQNFR